MQFWITSIFLICSIWICTLPSASTKLEYPKCVIYKYIGRSMKATNETASGRSAHGPHFHSKWKNCPYCGIPGSKMRIVGGRSAVPFEFPWLVNILKNEVQHCGGSILAARYVLTAAHCLYNIDIHDLVVMAAVHDVTALRIVTVKVKSTAVHPLYEPLTYDYDAAILKLSRKFKFGSHIRPICLPPPGYDATARLATVSGWGATGEESDAAERLLKVQLPVVSNDECKRAKGLSKYKITERMICAGDTAGGKDACKGDSGGPLVIADRNIYMQIGVVSWGVGCARPDFYGVYTKVHLFLDWIAENTPDIVC